MTNGKPNIRFPILYQNHAVSLSIRVRNPIWINNTDYLIQIRGRTKTIKLTTDNLKEYPNDIEYSPDNEMLPAMCTVPVRLHDVTTATQDDLSCRLTRIRSSRRNVLLSLSVSTSTYVVLRIAYEVTGTRTPN